MRSAWLRQCAALVIIATCALLGVSVQEARASGNPYDSAVATEPPIPTKGLMVWWSGAARAYYQTGGNIELLGGAGSAVSVEMGPYTAGDVAPWGSGWSFPAQGAGRVMVTTDMLRTPGDEGLTIVFDYQLQADKQPLTGWNPLFSLSSTNESGWTWALMAKNGVPQLISRAGTQLTGDTPGALPGGTSNSIDDGKVHQIALRVARPGCNAGNCPAPNRLIVSVLVDGTVRSEGPIDFPKLSTSTLAFNRLFQGTLWATNDLGLDFTGQPNMGAHLFSWGRFSQLAVYRRSLAVSELQRIERASALLVQAQVPPFGGVAAGWNGPAVAPTPWSSQNNEPTSAVATAPTDMLNLQAKELLTPAGLQNHSVSGWVKFPHAPASEQSVLRLVQPSGAVELLVSAVGGKTRLTCKVSGAATSAYYDFDFGTAPEGWHQVRLGTEYTKFCLVDLTWVGQISSPADPAFASSKLQVLAGEGVAVGNLVVKKMVPYGAGKASRQLFEDPFLSGPAVWLRGTGLEEALTLLPWRQKVDKGWWLYAPNLHALGIRASHKPVNPTPKLYKGDVVADNDDLTITARFHLTSKLPAGKSVCINHRSASALEFSVRTCFVDVFSTLQAYVMWGPRTFTVAAGVGYKVDTPIVLTFTAPYVHSPDYNKAYKFEAGASVPDFYSDGLRQAPGLGWSEQASVLYFPNNAYVNGKAPDGGYKYTEWWGVGSDPPLVLDELRIYPLIVRNAASIAVNSCEQEDIAEPCTDAGRVCEPGSVGESARCGACAPTFYALAGDGEPALECRPKREGGGECRANAMCLSGSCDLTLGRCLYASQELCTSECKTRGRTCGAKGQAFDCASCLANFAPTGAYEGATYLPPQASCGWAPTREDYETCSVDLQCKSGSCADTVIDIRDEVNLSGGWKTLTSQKCGDGWCDDSCFTCNSYVYQPDVTWAYQVPRTEKRCRVVAPAIPSSDPQAAPCAQLLGRVAKPGSELNVTLPDGSTIKTVQCAAGKDATCTRPGETSQAPILAAQACLAMVQRKGVEESDNHCHVKYKAALKCKHIQAVKGADTLATQSIQKTNPAAFSAVDLLRAFHPTLDDAQRNSPTLQYNHGAHFQALRSAGVGLRLIEYALGTTAQKAALAAKYGQFLPLEGCNANISAAQKAQSVYHNDYNIHTCLPEPQQDGAACPPAGATQNKHLYCMSNYCSRDTGTCERGDNPLYELRGNGQGDKKKGKSAVQFGVVRVDDTNVEVEDLNKGNQALAGQTTSYKYKADMQMRYVSCILGNPMPKTPLLQTDIEVDRTAGEVIPGVPSCASSELTVRVLGFDMSAIAPDKPLSSCTAASFSTQGMGYNTCMSADIGSCEFNPEKLLTAPLGNYFPQIQLCVPTDELNLPEVKKDFKEALVPLIISIGLDLEMCIGFAFGMDSKSNAPQVSVTPSLGIGVVARGGVGVGETGVYEISAGVRLLLTLVKIQFPITWGIEVDAVLSEVSQQKIVGFFKVELIQRLSMVLEFLSGEFGLYAAFEIGPFGIEWVFNIFEWTGLKFDFTLAEVPLISTKIDFQIPRTAPASGAAPACQPNECYK